MIQLSTNLAAHMALAGKMIAIDMTTVAIGTAKADEMNGVGTVMAVGVLLGARLVVR